MNLIKDNPFLTALIGITVVLCGGLYVLGSKGADKYEQAKSDFDNAYQAVTKSESIPLYPTDSNRDAKTKALADYREAIDGFRTLFDKYRKDKIENVSTQEFTERLVASNDQVTKALTAAGCEVPEDFFMGFEAYRDKLALTEATGLLDYQMGGLKHALLELAEARPTRLIKVYREQIPEEIRAQSSPQSDDVVRNFGFEVTFQGSEASAREFLSALGEIDPYYYVVRCVKIDNERDDPPAVSDAKFEKPKEKPKEADNPFGADFFGFDAEEPAPEGAAEEGAEPGPEAEPEVAAPEVEADPVDTTRILAQVLGGEEVLVFVRFDLTLFLPTKELPKP